MKKKQKEKLYFSFCINQLINNAHILFFFSKFFLFQIAFFSKILIFDNLSFYDVYYCDRLIFHIAHGKSVYFG